MNEDNKLPLATANDVSGLVTRHVFLDTQVYRQYAYNLGHQLMQALSKRLETGKLQLHITDITLSEIERQLYEEQEELSACLKKAMRKLEQWNDRVSKRERQFLGEVDSQQLCQKAFQEIKNTLTSGWMKNWNAEVHEAKKISAVDIFHDYFNNKPPFSTKGKHEFPDAFIIKALQQWCIENSKTMYVVTDDQEMLKAAEASSVLEPIKSLPLFLDLLTATEDPEVEKLVEKLLEDEEIVDQLNEFIDENSDKIELNYNGELPEIDACYLSSASISYINGFYVIGSGSQNFDLVLDITLHVQAKIEVSTASNGFAEIEVEDDASDPLKFFVSVNKKTKKLNSIEFISKEVSFSEPYGYFY